MTENDAFAIARQVAHDQGWTFAEPPFAEFRRKWFGKGGTWEVFSGRHGLGAKVRVLIDDATGRVLEKGYIPR
jgi:hypothetical protein